MNLRNASRVLLLAGVSLLATPVVPVAAAHRTVVLDQRQLTFSGGLSVHMNAFQTITTGVSGEQVRVDLPLCTTIKGMAVTISVRRERSSRPLATASIKFDHSYSDCAWYRFGFHRPFMARKGDILRLALRAGQGEAALWGSDPYPGHAYPRGMATWMGHTVNAFAFRTYVQVE